MADWQPPAEAFAQKSPWQPPANAFASGVTQAAPTKQPSQSPAEGLLARIRDTLSATGRGAMQGVGDIGYGAAQLAERVPDPLGFLPQPASIAKSRQTAQAGLDTAIQQRERAYQTSPSVMGHSTASAAGRLLGNIAATLPLGAAGGALARGVGLAGRLGAAAGTGAVASAMEPVGGKDFGTEKLKQAAYGAGGGLAGGVLGETVSSTLGKAIAGNSPGAIEKALTKQFRSAVKPSRVGQTSASNLGSQDRRILTAIDTIIAEKPYLKLTDEAGNVVTGQTPKTLRQFSEAIEQSKNTIFKTYDQMAQQAGQQGAMVDLGPVVTELRRVAKLPEVVDIHPNLAADANRLADTMSARGSYSAEEAQGVIQNLNKTLAGFYRNPTAESVSHASLLAPVARLLREGLDQSIERFQGPGYQALKLKYGALRSIEKDVAGAVQREANKLPGGIGGLFSDLAASEEAIRGVITLNPAALGRAATIKAAQKAMKYINSPNRAITRLFAKREASAQAPSALRSAIGAGLSRPYPGIGFALGGASLTQPTNARDYLKGRTAGDRPQGPVRLPSGQMVGPPQ